MGAWSSRAKSAFNPPQKNPGFQGLMVPPILDWEETLPCACPGGAGWEHMEEEGCRRMRRDGEG